MNVLIVATLALGLVVDQHWAIWGQVAVSAVVWLLFRQVWHRSDESRRLPLVACLVFATFGEMFLSLVWGLYQYRLGNIPMFVPPGHVLLFFLGMQVSERLPEGAEWWVAAIAGGVAVSVPEPEAADAPTLTIGGFTVFGGIAVGAKDES